VWRVVFGFQTFWSLKCFVFFGYVVSTSYSSLKGKVYIPHVTQREKKKLLNLLREGHWIDITLMKHNINLHIRD